MGKFEELYNINVNDKKEDRDGLSYLSWAWAWAEFKKRCPDANYKVWRDDQGRPYVYDENLGYMVFVEVTAENETHEMWLPVMDSKNKTMKTQPYTYKNKYGKEFMVQAATMFDINKTIMRCLAKCIGMFGLGLYIYVGEDLPEKEQALATITTPEGVLWLVKDTGITEEAICKYYNIPNVGAMTPDRYLHLNNNRDLVIRTIKGGLHE